MSKEKEQKEEEAQKDITDFVQYLSTLTVEERLKRLEFLVIAFIIPRLEGSDSMSVVNFFEEMLHTPPSEEYQ